mgnify:CR=1 FL=1
MNPIGNLSELNQKILDLYVTFDSERKSEKGFELSKLNFTWYSKTFENDRLHLKLNFSYPILISPDAIQDVLVIHFLEPEMFFSPVLGKKLH